MKQLPALLFIIKLRKLVRRGSDLKILLSVANDSFHVHGRPRGSSDVSVANPSGVSPTGGGARSVDTTTNQILVKTR